MPAKGHHLRDTGKEIVRGKKRSPEDIERGLQALAENGGNAEAASKETGIPARTLRGWKGLYSDDFAELRREKRTGLIDDVWGAAREALKQLKEKLPNMKGDKVAVAFGILVDKALVMGGEPDTISETKVSDARSKLLAAIEREMEDPEAASEREIA